MEVFAVSDVYVDGSPFVHNGIVISNTTLDICDDCGKTSESFSLSFADIDGTRGFSFQLKEVIDFFVYPIKKIIGFQLSPKYEQKSIIFDMTVSFPGDDDLLFVSFLNDTFQEDTPSILVLNTQKDARKYATSNFTRGNEVYRRVFTKKIQQLLVWDTKLLHPTFEFFRPYLRCYNNFVKQNPVKRREGKKILRKIDNLPKFLELYSGSLCLLRLLLQTFLVQHICRNPRCKNFSYLKCQACRGIYYCGKDCQIADWNSHREQCQHIQDIHAKVQLVANLLKTDGLISFKAFYSEVSYKSFEAVYDSLKTQHMSFLFGEDSILASCDVSQLVRRRGIKSQPFESFEKQIQKAFGEYDCKFDCVCHTYTDCLLYL